MPQLLSKAIEHMGSVGQPSPPIQRAPISQPPPRHTLHPQQGQLPGLPEGCEVPLRHICVHVLVKSGGRSRSLARHLCSRPHQTQALPSSLKAGPHSWAEAGSLSPRSTPCQGWPLTFPGTTQRILGANDHPDDTRGLSCYAGQLSRQVFEGDTVSEREEEEEGICVLLASLGMERLAHSTPSRDHAVPHPRNQNLVTGCKGLRIRNRSSFPPEAQSGWSCGTAPAGTQSHASSELCRQHPAHPQLIEALLRVLQTRWAQLRAPQTSACSQGPAGPALLTSSM